MPPRRPPPLNPTLFAPGGALGPGSAPLPPLATSVHPAYVIDAHRFIEDATSSDSPDALYTSLPAEMPRPPVKSAVQVKMNVSAEPAASVLGVKPFSIHPTILNLALVTPPSITNIAKGAVDIIVPCVAPLSDKEWDLLDEAVNALDGSWSSAGVTIAGTQDKTVNGKEGGEAETVVQGVHKPTGGRIVISGLLPPPLTATSAELARDPAYEYHIARLNQLALMSNVYLKVLPPVVLKCDADEWVQDAKELQRVLRMYLSPAIEAFGTHRLLFGTSTALPTDQLARHPLTPVELVQPISENEWYTILRKTLTELGEDAESVGAIFGSNAATVYGLL